MIEITKQFVKENMPNRPMDANKGTMGTLLNISGSYSMAGACILSSMSALKSGVGLVKVALPKSIYPIVASQVYEAVFVPFGDANKMSVSASEIDYLLSIANLSNATLLGCGLSLVDDTVEFVRDFVLAYTGALLLDADGINAVALNIDVLKDTKAQVVLTPHAKEMARLIKKDVSYVLNNREQVAVDFAKEYSVTVVLKGKDTIVTDGNKVYVNKTGNAGMAKGGSGDVLSGIIASLMAQGKDPLVSACMGVYIHGLCGDIAAKNLSQSAMLPRDIVDYLPQAFLNIEN